MGTFFAPDFITYFCKDSKCQDCVNNCFLRIFFIKFFTVIIYFQDEPVGGAARFLTAVKSHGHLNPMVLFSGDCFAPSTRKYNPVVL